MSELIPNADFSCGAIGGLPECWEVGTRNPALHPKFELTERDGRRALQAVSNGNHACFGWLQTRVTLQAGQHYRFAVRLCTDGLADVDRHVIHGIYGVKGDGGYFNTGILAYTRDGDAITGETVFASPEEDTEVTVRLYFRYGTTGSVRWEHVSLQPCDAPAQRLAKIAVVKGQDKLEHWQKVLDRAGEAKCDIVLLPEMFDENGKPMNAVTLDSPPVRLLADNARRHRMYTAGCLYLKRGELPYNTTVIFDRNGELLGVHEKVVLYDPESDQGAAPGEAFNVFTADFGRVGVMTCYESWFPATAQLLALKGAELILFPSAGYYEQLIHARSADNGVVIAASSLGCAGDIWDPGGNRASGIDPDPTRNAPTNITAVETVPELQLLMATVDLNQHPSPHSWGGPMKSAPGGRRVRNTAIADLQSEICTHAKG